MFRKNAPKHIQKILSKHIDVLNGKEVAFDEQYGTSEPYVFEGQEFELYPVYKDWCREVKDEC